MDAVTEPKPHEFTFQAEIQQLLHLLAHSLYQSREIALRELISNASDALDKMRYVALTDESQRDDAPLEITIECRKDAGELVIRDNGVGMTRDELVTNLGTIAHSGSREFLKSAVAEASEGEEKKPTDSLSLIGQFGVGFYSAFMIADKVRVRSRSYKETEGWQWESEGAGTFRVEPAGPLPRGTEIVLHLKEDAKEFAEDWRISSAVRKYSSFVPHPIKVGDAVVNTQKPIWVEPKSQVTEEQYRQFYQHLTHHTDESPLWHIHLSAEFPLQYKAIVYCPPTNVELLGYGREEYGLSLCARRVLVQSHCRELLPEYLRFLHGIVDSEDLPLNVSRETLQDNTIIRRIRTALVKAVFDTLDKKAEDSPAEFLTFYRQFGNVLKEAVARDPMNRDRVAKLLRFISTKAENPDEPTSLGAYVGRMAEGQKSIYYLGGPDLSALKKSPNLEIFRRRGVEVLYLTDPVDEFVLSALGAFEGKPLVSIDSADVDLPPEEKKTEDAAETPKAEEATPSAGLGRVITLFKEALGDRVADVRESKRLTDSPCCLVNAEGSLSTQMQRLLKMANKDFTASARILEINPSSPLVRRLGSLSANSDHDDFIRRCAMQLWANALLLEGTLAEPEAIVARNQAFMEEAAEKRSPLIF
ncbi:MAG: molecular chaperone HtpG [Isosphaeraceae bacterium]